jgi:glycerophosphoryl diester phosphodiesterase
MLKGKGMSRLPLIIGHRGASHDAPENTLAAFQLAFGQGADGIEADFRLTRDHRVVCMHDKTSGRTAGVPIPVEEASLDELRRLDVGSWKGERWSGERIPTLDEVLASLPAGKMFFIELKSGAEIVPHVREVLARTTVSMEWIRLLTFDAELAGVLTAMIPDVRVCLNVEYRRNFLDGVLRPSPEEILRTLARCGAAGLSSQAHGSFVASFAEALRRNGKELHIWTVDSPEEARNYLDIGVDSLMTNRPGFLKEGLS